MPHDNAHQPASPDATATVDPFLAQCFWTYPPTGEIPPGTPLTFQVVVPPAVPATSLIAGGYPLTGTAVSWALTGADGAFGPGDYQVLAGDLQSELLTVVFKPGAGTVKVLPKLSLFYAGLNSPATSNFTGQTYTLAPVSADGEKAINEMIAGTLGVSAVKTIVEPGETAVLRVAPRPAAVPQVVTSILHDAPSVEIRGAIPLDPLVEAIMGPLTGALGRVLPGSKATLEAGAADVRRLLAEPLAIPVAIDVLGTRLTTTTAPVGVPEMALLTSLPEQGGAFAGMVPIGRWQSPFQIASATWKVQEKVQGVMVDAPLCDLSPGAGFLKAFLLKPEVVPLAAGSQAGVAPTPITVTATLHVTFPDGVVKGVDLELPPLTLLRLPLALPSLAAVFRHSFNDIERQDEQWVYLITDYNTAVFAPTRDDATRLLTRLGSALNTVVAAANLLGSEWKELLDLASAVSMLAQAMGRIPDSSIYFSPVWSPGGHITLEDDFANQVSAFIWIGIPGTSRFELGDCAKSNCIIAPRGGSTSFSSVLPTLNGPFESLTQLPPNSADSTYPTFNFNDKMNMIGW